MQYKKSALSNTELLSRLESKGLIIDAPDVAMRALDFIGYFRLRGYALPFMYPTSEGKKFTSGITFNDILLRYEFDRDLRRLVLGQLESIEIAVRTSICNHMAIDYGPFWYLNYPMQVLGHQSTKHKVSSPFEMGAFLNHVERTARRSRDLHAQHYFKKYSDPLFPPSWLMAECLSFGYWSKLYKHLQKGNQTKGSPKKIIARKFDLTPSLFESWLHALTFLRNICAHHGRVWNRQFAYRPEVYLKKRDHFLNQQSFYCYASVIAIFLEKINSENGWSKQLVHLFRDYPKISQDDLGFPSKLHQDPIWKLS